MVHMPAKIQMRPELLVLTLRLSKNDKQIITSAYHTQKDIRKF